MKPKILALDIETKPATVYAWRMYDENIGADQIIEEGGVICVGATWVGSAKGYFFSDWQHGHKRMLREIHKLMSEADAILTYNGDRFDIPKLTGAFLLAGLKPLPPLTSIDAYKAVKRFGFALNKLARIGPLLELGQKVKHEGFSLWAGVMAGDPKAQAKMERYCKQDVRLLVQLYEKIKPFIKDHPHLGLTISKNQCGACGSRKMQRQGYRRTKSSRTERLQCQACGSWQTGARRLVE